MTTNEERKQVVKELFNVFSDRYKESSFDVEKLTKLYLQDVDFIFDKYSLSEEERAFVALKVIPKINNGD